MRIVNYIVTSLLLLLASLISISCGDEAKVLQTINDKVIEEASGVVRIGPNRAFITPSAAAPNVQDGDVIEIDAGTYQNDAVVWAQNSLIIRGIGKPHIQANGAHAEGKGTWLIKGNDTVIEGIEFSGAAVPDENGAAIRLEGRNLTLRDCYIHDNENGFLCGEDMSSQVVFEFCEFANNGFGDGYTHNMYIGRVGRFILQCSYVHHAKIGHNVKSRAAESYVLYNRIMDEKSGTSSYAIDTPNGGLVYVIGNSIQQGSGTDNSTIVAYGAEGQTHSLNEFYAVNNTIVNENDGGLFIDVLSNASASWIMNNLLVGPGQISQQSAMLSNNIFTDEPRFVDKAGYNYKFLPDSPAVNAGVALGTPRDFNLVPENQYVHSAKCQTRTVVQAIDVGAFEYFTINSVP
jgi:hypothetical protein